MGFMAGGIQFKSTPNGTVLFQYEDVRREVSVEAVGETIRTMASKEGVTDIVASRALTPLKLPNFYKDFKNSVSRLFKTLPESAIKLSALESNILPYAVATCCMAQKMNLSGHYKINISEDDKFSIIIFKSDTRFNAFVVHEGSDTQSPINLAVDVVDGKLCIYNSPERYFLRLGSFNSHPPIGELPGYYGLAQASLVALLASIKTKDAFRKVFARDMSDSSSITIRSLAESYGSGFITGVFENYIGLQQFLKSKTEGYPAKYKKYKRLAGKEMNIALINRLALFALRVNGRTHDKISCGDFIGKGNRVIASVDEGDGFTIVDLDSSKGSGSFKTCSRSLLSTTLEHRALARLRWKDAGQIIKEGLAEASTSHTKEEIQKQIDRIRQEEIAKGTLFHGIEGVAGTAFLVGDTMYQDLYERTLEGIIWSDLEDEDKKCLIKSLAHSLRGTLSIHGKDLGHKDIKPANIFYDRELLGAVGDLGSTSKIDKVDSLMTTERYSPREDSVHRLDSWDAWSWGITLHDILVGVKLDRNLASLLLSQATGSLDKFGVMMLNLFKVEELPAATCLAKIEDFLLKTDFGTIDSNIKEYAKWVNQKLSDKPRIK